MARRRTKRKTRRSPQKTNLLNVAQSVILGNAVTEGLFNTNMYEFVTGRINGAFEPGSVATSSQITLPELLGAGFGATETMRQGQFGAIVSSASGYGGVHGSFGEAVKSNLQANGVQMMSTLILTPIAFKVVSKLASKPRREFNKLARTVGLPVSI
ncbi:MAG: hypothetical protein ACPHEN_06810 [Candidatus Poseidoniaceae archaeon]